MALVLLSSVASFASLSVLSLFARDEVGASDTMVTVYFVVVAVASMVAMLVTGHVSDRGRARQILISVSLAWLAAGYWVFASVRSYSAMLVVGVVFFCAINVPNAQLLAYARDLVQRRGHTASSIAVISLVRIVFSVGSFVGFASGGIGLAYLGARPVFRITAVLCVGCLVLSWYALRNGTAAGPPEQQELVDETGADSDQVQSRRTGQRLLLVLAVAMVLFSSGRVMQLSQLPILMRATLHAPLELVGIALAVPPLCELVLMPAMAWAALRWGRGKVFLVGAAAIVVYYCGLVFITTPWQLMLLQVSYAVFGAATIMVGIDLAQSLMSGQAGMATSMYLSHENIAVVHGSVVATVSVAALGHQTGFAVPGALCLVALALTVGLFARYPRQFDLRRRGVSLRTGPG